MSAPAVVTEHLRKTFRVGRTRRLPAHAQVAVDGISLRIERGERVAFIGPNGAGKSTTLKLMSGILHPDGGEARVLGLVPWKERKTLGFRLGTVFGQRSQLWQDLPPSATFALLRHVYERPADEHQHRLAELVDAFQLQPLLERPVRKLSLGERMRAEIVASLLHAPDVLLLDEPTIGLDVTAKAVIRELVRERSERDGMTLLLTSHDTGDVERVCQRVIIIHRGRIVLDCAVGDLRSEVLATQRVTLTLDRSTLDLELSGARITEASPFRLVVEIEPATCSVGRLVQAVTRRCGLRDVAITDPPLEELIRKVYATFEQAPGAAQVQPQSRGPDQAPVTDPIRQWPGSCR